jgi:hypothetical protein
MKTNIITILKIATAILLLICLFNLPYLLEKILNIIIFSGFIFLAFMCNGNKKEWPVFMLLAITFQPFFTLDLGLQTWQMIQIIVSTYLILDFFQEKEFQ